MKAGRNEWLILISGSWCRCAYARISLDAISFLAGTCRNGTALNGPGRRDPDGRQSPSPPPCRAHRDDCATADAQATILLRRQDCDPFWRRSLGQPDIDTEWGTHPAQESPFRGCPN